VDYPFRVAGAARSGLIPIPFGFLGVLRVSAVNAFLALMMGRSSCLVSAGLRISG